MELDKFESNAEIQDLFFNFNGIGKEDFKEDIYFDNLHHLMGYYLHSFKLTLSNS